MQHGWEEGGVKSGNWIGLASLMVRAGRVQRTELTRGERNAVELQREREIACSSVKFLSFHLSPKAAVENQVDLYLGQ
ncbi:hypothetical protein JZ751_029003 [Albula glossodonta]|uniref:Uncharacterized protein n=1 Tax=Albula glossodonta TaxID=121402 RepID=A0A8T2PAD6_9TELE|nr:hypothetical protein JZ751_029003 [Albula glossodonta]